MARIRRGRSRRTAADLRLAKAAVSGDREAFERFLEAHVDRLYAFAASRLGGDREALREVVQNTFCTANDRLPSYRGESALFTWICGICRFEILAWRTRRLRVLVEAPRSAGETGS